MSASRKISLRTEKHNGLPRSDEVMARDTVSKCLQHFRTTWGHVVGMEKLAPFLRMSLRQFRGWMYSETGYTGPRERHTVRMGVVNALRWYADELEKRADEIRRDADAIECHEKQLTLWRDEQPWVGSGRRAA